MERNVLWLRCETIAKYSSGSELNMFHEYTMAFEERFSEFFGFTAYDELKTKEEIFSAMAVYGF